METMLPRHLHPTLPMLAEYLTQSGWQWQIHLSREDRGYRGIRLYHPRLQLQEDVLYLLRPGETEFPVDDYSYLSSVSHGGKANHLICPDHPDEEILDQLLEVFSLFHSWESDIDLLLYRGASVQTLCELGARLMEKPVCFHDDWFVMMAMSAGVSRIMEPEYLMSSARGFIPRAIVEDFQDNSDYLETYAHHDARIWVTPDGRYQTLYVNLWDGAVYKGRMLVMQTEEDFRRRDFLLAEVLAQRAVLMLRRKTPGAEEIHQDMDDIVFSLLQGRQTDPADLSQLMNMLRWKESDRFLCLRVRPQQNTGNAMAEHVLHSDLFRSFPGSYVLLGGQEQCVVLNLNRVEGIFSQVRHRLAPLCRDHGLYAGISSPVTGIRDLCAAYYQAGAALEQAFLLRSEKWILFFAECALDHLIRNLPSPLVPGHLAAPELNMLRDYDREKGTAYFETLRAYLLQERDIPRTSETLIIHRTTLLYRLKKIRSLIQTDLDDPWQRMYWLLSLWILEKEGL